ncbi:MAG: hypothetical protein H6810_01540 [Phycisphaeraceae bacterium]|nr:MAG: hypothetical protein H6810_01540 [Phycisphaeraceae bacterium]
MRRSLCILIVGLGSAGVTAAPVTWTDGNGHTYDLVITQSPMTWAQAKADAESRGGYLATITSRNENAFISNALDVVNVDEAWATNSQAWLGPWLGGFQPDGSPEPGGGWQWVTGEVWDFTWWHSGEPSNTGTGHENALHFFGYQSEGRRTVWNDTDGDATLLPSYIIEYDVPAPAGLAVVVGGLACTRRRR